MHAKDFQGFMAAALKDVAKDKAGFYKADALKAWSPAATGLNREAARSYRNRCHEQDKASGVITPREGYNPRMQALVAGLNAEGVEIVLSAILAWLAEPSAKATSASKVAALQEELRVQAEEMATLREQVRLLMATKA